MKLTLKKTISPLRVWVKCCSLIQKCFSNLQLVEARTPGHETMSNCAIQLFKSCRIKEHFFLNGWGSHLQLLLPKRESLQNHRSIIMATLSCTIAESINTLSVQKIHWQHSSVATKLYYFSIVFKKKTKIQYFWQHFPFLHFYQCMQSDCNAGAYKIV